MSAIFPRLPDAAGRPYHFVANSRQSPPAQASNVACEHNEP
jgi:hypothetical protein